MAGGSCCVADCVAAAKVTGLCRPHYDLSRKRRLRYGMSLEDFDVLLAAQGGVCAICARAETKVEVLSGRVQPLSVDHDHRSGAVRGLLCNSCNVGLANFGDDPERLVAAAEYLRCCR